MGYTHYWSNTPAFTEGFAHDVDLIVAKAQEQGIVIRGWDGTGEPVFSPTEIRFNGDGEQDQDFETFVLVPGEQGFTFCKTGRMPYDAVVGAILIALKESDPSFFVQSDGVWDDVGRNRYESGDWDEPRTLYAAALGREAVNPLSED